MGGRGSALTKKTRSLLKSLRGGGGAGSLPADELSAVNALKQVDKQEQLSLDNGTRITKIDTNSYLIDGTGAKGVILGRADARDYLKSFSGELKSKGFDKPIEKLIKKAKVKDIVDKPKQLRLPPVYEKTSISMGKVLREVNTRNKLESGSAKIQKIDGRNYLVNHPDYDRPRILNQSELRRFIRDNENDFDGFRKKA